MAELEKQVRRVLRRLSVQQFVEILVWCWVASLFVALGWITVEKFWRPIVEPWVSVAASLALGVLAALVVWIFRRPSSLDAALALDEAFALKERVSSTLTLPADLRESPAGTALISDTARRVETIDVGEKFGLQLPRNAWVPLVPAILVFLVASFLKIDKSGTVEAKIENKKEQEQIKQSTKVLTKRIEEQQQKAKESGLTETEKLLAELATKAKDAVEDGPEMDQKKALAKMSEFQDALKERREKLGSSEQLQKQLEKLKSTTETGPADKFAEAMKQGDFKKAADELSKLTEQMKSGKMDEAQMKALSKQLGQLKDQLEKLANVEDRKKQLEEQLKKAGMPEDQIKKELAKLDAQAKQLEKLAELAQKMAQAQEAMNQGDMEKAAESLNLSRADLQQLMNELQELEMLEEAMNQLADMKNAMVCKNCGGGG
jgi:chemotaxis protein histidine kinase CheA